MAKLLVVKSIVVILAYIPVIAGLNWKDQLREPVLVEPGLEMLLHAHQQVILYLYTVFY